MNWEYIKYRFQKALSKGGVAMFLSLVAVFLICFFTIVTIRFFLVELLPETEDVFHDFGMHMWVTFLAMTDPGNMNQDNLSHIPFKVTAILAGLLGVIIFSTLIAFITTLLENNYYKLRKGRSKVMESHHTLILGWNEKVVEIIKELIYANESHNYASVVILSDYDKDKMDDVIAKSFTDTKTTSIFVSSGDPANLSELKRVNAEKAKSVIVLANCPESGSDYEKELSDIHVIKTILAMYAAQGRTNSIPIVVELFNPTKNELINFFNDDKIIAFNNWRIMGKLLLQTSLTTGLIKVYDEILAFSGNEIYITPYKGPKMNFYEAATHYHDGILLGLKDEKNKILLRPPFDTEIKLGQKLIILAQDDSTIKMSGYKLAASKTLPFHYVPLDKKVRKILVLGWHEIGYHYINESLGHMPEGSHFEIVYNQPPKEIQQQITKLKKNYKDLSIQLTDNNPFIYDVLVSLNPYSYDNVVILPQNIHEPSPEKMDTDTLIIMMMLRQMKLQPGFVETGTKLISQLLNSDNEDLIIQTDIDDFITSNKLITKIIAQLSEQPELKELYDDLFSNEGSEIYVKPASLYFQDLPMADVTFLEIMNLVNNRNEICMGLRIGAQAHEPDKNFGVLLNPNKLQKFTISAHDYLVVLAEDEC
jgi:hypothetical protein